MTDPIYKFKCHIVRQIFCNEESGFRVYRFSTHTELPNTQRLNNNYQDIKKNHSSTKIFEGSLNGNITPLKIGREYDVEAKITPSRKGEIIYYNYNVIKISPLMTTENDKVKFLRTICTERQSEEIIKSCPTFIDLVINDQDIPKIKYIGIKSLDKIKKNIHENYWLNEILTWLTPLGITNKMIHKLAEGETDYHKLKIRITENPYLMTKIRGLGFKKIDGLALKINPEIKTSQYRLESFTQWYFTDIANSRGDTLISKEEFEQAKQKYVP